MKLFHGLSSILCLQLATNSVYALWPIPRHLQTGTTFLKLGPTLDIKLELGAGLEAPQDLLDAISRTKERLRTDKLQRLVVGRGDSDREGLVSTASLGVLTLTVTADTVIPIAKESVKGIGLRDEAYSLTLPDDGSAATIQARTSLGLLRGLTTWEQLWYWVAGDSSDEDGVVYAYQTPVVIENDSPAFPYRGFMLDTARNFFPVADIKRTLDAMSMVKMSVFHWHVVDSQSFPLDVLDFPELSRKGAYSALQIYSPSDVQSIVQYAAERGIDVLMEIDTPGHTAIIANSYPEHIACPYASPSFQFANEPPAGQLRVASSATRDFTVSILRSIARTLPSTMFSTGGDEINVKCFDNDESTQRDLENAGLTLDEALNEFTLATHQALKDLGKKVVVWEEMALNHRITLANDTIVMVWTSSRQASKVVAKGLQVVHAPSDYFYLDCGGGEWLGNVPGMNSWCDPFKSWQKAYTFDPIAGIRGQAHLILGGQHLLWTEQASPENLDPITWPRAAASAEVFWTGAKLPDGTTRSVASALPRLHDLRYRMVQRRIRAIPLQPHWCALRPGRCDMDDLPSMLSSFVSRRLYKVIRWYRAIASILTAKYREHFGITEL